MCFAGIGKLTVTISSMTRRTDMEAGYHPSLLQIFGRGEQPFPMIYRGYEGVLRFRGTGPRR